MMQHPISLFMRKNTRNPDIAWLASASPLFPVYFTRGIRLSGLLSVILCCLMSSSDGCLLLFFAVLFAASLYLIHCLMFSMSMWQGALYSPLGLNRLTALTAERQRGRQGKVYLQEQNRRHCPRRQPSSAMCLALCAFNLVMWWVCAETFPWSGMCVSSCG